MTRFLCDYTRDVLHKAATQTLCQGPAVPVLLLTVLITCGLLLAVLP